jgi:hypothetical protein
MPNLAGSVLQTAQDTMQRITGNPAFFTTSTDVTGQGRAQVLDRNWKVCSQSLAAKATFTVETVIDFGVVKLEETCP